MGRTLDLPGKSRDGVPRVQESKTPDGGEKSWTEIKKSEAKPRDELEGLKGRRGWESRSIILVRFSFFLSVVVTLAEINFRMRV